MAEFIIRKWLALITALIITVSLPKPLHSLLPTMQRQANTIRTNLSRCRNTPHDYHHQTRQSSPELRESSITISIPTETKSIVMSRRQLLLLSAATTLTLLPVVAKAANGGDGDSDDDSDDVVVDGGIKSLEDLELGRGRWEPIEQSGTPASSHEGSSFPEQKNLSNNVVVPASFATYLARFLINYDDGVNSWWNGLNESCSLMSDSQRQETLRKSFGALAASIQLALEKFLRRAEELSTSSEPSRFNNAQVGEYTELARLLISNYGSGAQKLGENDGNDAQRQIALLFAMLPPEQQPLDVLSQLFKQTSIGGTRTKTDTTVDEAMIGDDFSTLLSQKYRLVQDNSNGISSYSIFPTIHPMEVDSAERIGQTAVQTAFGPISPDPLTREIPRYSPDIYALFGISGATGCALTHAVVIPLDVVKTKAQTDPEEYKDVFKGAQRIIENEGVQGLLTGAQATLAGYFWYGLSVYPSYAFFKRYMALSLLPPEIAAVHANDIALIAGALAAVIASLGLTPLEAARIRVVAEPERYRPLGLTGTLGVIANEDPSVGWKAVYAGLPSLLARQVIFGSVKFLAFERACEAIYTVWPFLREATWTALMVSLVAGGFSGTLSSVVSQPADSVLTYVAQNSGEKGSLGLIEGCFLMVEEDGLGSLFRGLGSRCVWAGSIIAGQFLLYDVFRTAFGVSGQDLSQVFQIAIPDMGP